MAVVVLEIDVDIPVAVDEVGSGRSSCGRADALFWGNIRIFWTGWDEHRGKARDLAVMELCSLDSCLMRWSAK